MRSGTPRADDREHIAEVRERDRPGVRELLARLEDDCRAHRAVVAMLLFTVTGRVA
jgi:hypothetical protein